LEGRLYHQIRQLIKLRKENPAFAGTDLEVIDTGSDHVLGYIRQTGDQRILLFASFTEAEQLLPGNLLRIYGRGRETIDLSSGDVVPLGDIRLLPYAFLCLQV
jgi:glycosidase